MDVLQSYRRVGWYQICGYDSPSFEFNPLASLSQATNKTWGIRRPLFYVRQSFHVSSFGVIRVQSWTKPNESFPKFASFDDAFAFVEQFAGYESPKSIEQPSTCPTCGQSLLNLYFSAGRPKSFCSDACKMKAYRQRHRNANTQALRNEPLRNPLASSIQQTSWLDIAS